MPNQMLINAFERLCLSIERNQFWKLFIDMCHHHHPNGPNVFDFDREVHPGEPGYIRAMTNAFLTVVKCSLGEPLTIDMVEMFHTAATKNVAMNNEKLRHHKIVEYSLQQELSDPGLSIGKYDDFCRIHDEANRTRQVHDGFPISCTQEGLEEIFYLLNSKTNTNFYYYPYMIVARACVVTTRSVLGQLRLVVISRCFPLYDMPSYFQYKDCRDFFFCNGKIPKQFQKDFKMEIIAGQQSRATIPEAIRYHIDQYYCKLRCNVPTDSLPGQPIVDVRLHNICHLVSTLERIHPFFDGNCRTMLLVFYKLLFEQFQTFAILRNPNSFDGFSRLQLVKEVLDGIKIFDALLPPRPMHVANL